MRILKKLSLVFFLIFSIQSTVYADEEENGYSVSPLFSEHQSEGVDNFFDIVWTPGVEELFDVRISNNSKHKQIYSIQVNKARTNKNGIVDYSNNKTEKSAIKYKLTEMIKMPKEVTVEAHSSVTVNGIINFEDKDFNGILMAGIHVSEKRETTKTEAISNSVAYNIPFVVRGNRDDRPKPILELKAVNLEKNSSTNYALNVSLDNKKANLMKDVTFVANIKNEQGESIIKQESKLDITPETNFIYPIKLTSNLKPGNYKLELKATHNNKNKWEFNKSFEISKQEAKAIKEEYDYKNDNVWIYIGVGLVFLAALSYIIIIRRKR